MIPYTQEAEKEDCKFQTNMGYIGILSQNEQKTQTPNQNQTIFLVFHGIYYE
jgi:hypothetical protein